ncbi:MAG: hypothetical protein JNL47_10400 [Bacteroidia bacterium]|nr:hypothetical protein [Bacteroidia bacterium]
MNLEIILVGLAIIIICAVPFVLMGIGKKNKTKELLEALYGFASKHHCIIREYEAGGDFIIGLDTDRKIIIFYKSTPHEKVMESLNLDNVRHCRCVTSETERKTASGAAKSTDKIEWIFTFADKDKPELIWKLFDSKNDLILLDEHQFASRWAERINKVIKAK